MNKVKSEDLALATLSNLLNFNHQLLFYLKHNFCAWQNIFLAKRNDLIKLKLNEKYINRIMHIKEKKILKQLEINLENNQINLLSYKDPLFPSLLKEVKNFPLVLFYQGSLHSLTNHFFSIVGSRNCSLQAQSIVNYLLNKLQTKYSLVSGLALGIDSYVHKIALKNNLHTCAILGSGLNQLYPKENISLAQEIIHHQGCLMSQFLPSQKPLKHHFPIRNQIIAAMSFSTLVIEAKAKSGALITANLALDYGRNVAAVPGSILSKQHQGSNELIKNGAIVISKQSDIIETLLDSNF